MGQAGVGLRQYSNHWDVAKTSLLQWMGIIGASLLLHYKTLPFIRDLQGHLIGEPKILNGDLNLFIRVPKNKNKNLMRRFMYDDDFFPVLRFRGLNLHQRRDFKSLTRLKPGLCVCLDPSKAQIKTRVLDGLESSKNQPS